MCIERPLMNIWNIYVEGQLVDEQLEYEISLKNKIDDMRLETYMHNNEGKYGTLPTKATDKPTWVNDDIKKTWYDSDRKNKESFDIEEEPCSGLYFDDK